MDIYIAEFNKLILRNKYSDLYERMVIKYFTRDLPINEILEKHHILPVSFTKETKFGHKDKLNIIRITPREHFILHRVLEKCIYLEPKNKTKMQYAVSCFFRNKLRRNLNSRQYEICRLAVIKATKNRKTSDKTKNKLSVLKKGKCCFYDGLGNSHYLNLDDPKIRELNLKGNRNGKTTVKDLSGKIFTVDVTDPRLISNEFVGIRKNMATYVSSDGKKYNLNINDPIIKELNLLHINTGTKFKMPEGTHKGNKNSMFGRVSEVCCFDLEKKIFLRVTKEVFLQNKNLVGVNSKVVKEYKLNLTKYSS